MGILEEYWNTLQVDSLQSEPPGKPNYDINSLKTLNKRKKNNDSVTLEEGMAMHSSILENPMDKGACSSPGGRKKLDTTE